MRASNFQTKYRQLKLNIYDTNRYYYQHCVLSCRFSYWIFISKSSLNSKAKFIVKDAKKTAENIIENANVKAEAIKKEKEAQAKVKFLELKSQHDENIQSREKKCKKQKRIRDKEQKLNDELSKTGKLEKDLERQVADYKKNRNCAKKTARIRCSYRSKSRNVRKNF
jgi:ribonuclease Y